MGGLLSQRDYVGQPRVAAPSGYPGKKYYNTCTPKGFRNCGTVLRNPVGVERNAASVTQGSRCAATLGCPTKALWATANG